MPRFFRDWLGMATLAVMLVACGGTDEVPPFEVDEAIQPFVGTWDAEVFTVTSEATPTRVFDLFDPIVTGSFDLKVEPSGFYTAILVFGGIPLVEMGQLSVNDGFVTLRPNAPGASAATSAFTFFEASYLQLLGPTEFDYNLDGTLEAAEALIEIRRR